MKLALGTAQLGLHYGVNNSKGLLSEHEAQELLQAAWDSGFTMLDTSSEYGLAEKRIAAYLSAHPDTFTVLRRGAGGYVSVYTDEEARKTDATMVQLPANMLDGRLDGTIKRLRAAGKMVLVRSLMLQGLLAWDMGANPAGNIGNGSFIYDAMPYIWTLQLVAKEYGITLPEVAVRWAWELDPDVAILGAETPRQVKQLGEWWARGPLLADMVARVKAIRSTVPERVISPRMWGQVYEFTTAATR